MSSDNSSLYLQQYDDRYTKIYLPTILFLGILMLLGLVGNVVVLFVYICKFKPCTTRFFIIAMGVLDLLNCAISIPVQILELRYSATFGGFGLCQVLVMCLTFFSMSSASILLAVAVDRYRKICRPFRKQVTPYAAKIVCAVCCALTGIFTIPTALIYGPIVVPLDHVNATVCALRDESALLYHVLYTVIQMVIFIAASVTLIVLYTLIWCQVRRQQVVRRRLSQSHSSDRSKVTPLWQEEEDGKSSPNSTTMCSCFSSSSNCNSINGDITYKIGYHREDDSVNIHTTHSCQAQQSKANSTELKGAFSSAKNSLKIDQDHSRAQKQTSVTNRQNGSRKVTLMLFLITLVFIISYLPYLAIMACDAIDDTILDNIRALAAILEKFYYVQSVSNPIIYSFCNTNFRHHVKRVFLRK